METLFMVIIGVAAVAAAMGLQRGMPFAKPDTGVPSGGNIHSQNVGLAEQSFVTSIQTHAELPYGLPPLERNVDPDIPEQDRQDDEVWRKSDEAIVVWNNIRTIIDASLVRGEPAGLTTNECAILIGCLQSPHYFARWKGVITAGNAGSEPSRSILMPYVIPLLKDPVYRVRKNAASSLAYMVRDKSVVGYLEPLLGDPDRRVAGEATYAIDWVEKYTAGEADMNANILSLTNSM